MPFQPTLWKQLPDQAASGQVLEQVWLAGAHTNVGGGYDDTGLSDITLSRVIEKAQQHGLRFELTFINRLFPNSLGELRDSRAGWVNKLLYRRRVLRTMPERDDNKQLGRYIHSSVEHRLRNRIMPYQPGHLPKKYWRYPVQDSTA